MVNVDVQMKKDYGQMVMDTNSSDKKREKKRKLLPKVNSKL